MKKTYFRLIILFLGVIVFGFTFRQAEALPAQLPPASIGFSSLYVQATSSSPENTPQAADVIAVTEDRVLPPVGKDAGMVLGASLLVLIIIGGVLGSRRRAKH